MADPGTIAVKVALTAAQMALTASQHTKGPRLDSRKVTLADYGTPIYRFWGIRRFDGLPIIWSEDLREKKVKSKSKGGKYSEYKYWGSWAVLIADQEIQGIRRIWMDKQLVYDLSGTGPVSVASLFNDPASTGPIKLSNGRNLRVYLGTEDQMPDPRIEDWCENEYGAGTAPAYRGSAYVVFENIPLEKFGNRIPQITIEAVANVEPNPVWEQVPADPSEQHMPGFAASVGMRSFIPNYWVWDTATRSPIGPTSTLLPTDRAIDRDGNIWAIYGLPTTYVQRWNPEGTAITSAPIEIPHYTDQVFCVGGGVYFRSGVTIHNYAQWVAGAEAVAVDVGFPPNFYFANEDDEVWCCGHDAGTIHFARLSGTPHSFTIANPDGPFYTGTASAFFNSDGNIFVLINFYVLLIDPETGTILASDTIPSTGGNPFLNMQFTAPGSGSVWLNTTEVDSRTLQVRRTLGSGYVVELMTCFYDPINHALVNPRNSGHITWFFLDRIGSEGTSLRQIVEDVSEWAGLPYVDALDLDQIVQGYSVVQGSAKEMLNPLLDMHDCDARPHGFVVEFIKRGSAASGATLLTTDFVREGDNPRFVVSIDQDTDIPREVTVTFADMGKDQQSNTVVSMRPLDAMDSQRKETIDFSTYVSTPDEAQRLSDRRLRRLWNGRGKVKNALTPMELTLEPGDVKTLQIDSVTWTARCTSMTVGKGAIECEWERDFPGLAILGTAVGPTMDGRTPDAIYIPGPSKGFVVDIPLIRDSDESATPALHYAAGGYTSGGFIGAVVWRGDGTDYNEDWASVESSAGATWGSATDALAAPASPWLWDRANTVNIWPSKGTLSSSTEAAINADPTINLAYLGGELINFATATLEADGSYTLSGLRRGRRGTEGVIGDHAVGDVFILASGFATEGLGLSEVGNDQHFKVQTFGLDPTSASPIHIEPFTGATLKPYAPARVKAHFDGTDWGFQVIRRTRVGGSWNGSTIPLSEASEAYEIDVYDGATLKRTLALSGTDTVTYTNAMQVADFGATQTTKPSLIAVQLSDAVGRGFELAA